MEHIKIELSKKRDIGERTLLVDDIWKLYDSEKEDNLRKKENWKRYIVFLKGKRVKDSEIERKLFKKSRMFCKKMTSKQVAIKVSHLKKAELYYFFSECKRKYHKGYSIGSCILFNGVK